MNNMLPKLPNFEFGYAIAKKVETAYHSLISWRSHLWYTAGNEPRLLIVLYIKAMDVLAGNE
jgi:hypothetical protein